MELVNVDYLPQHYYLALSAYFGLLEVFERSENVFSL